ncbi:hypothetical protein VR41_06295 [Streptomyces sp. NRRL B-1568]|nr:hypothetical protein VR41_06295 [Streptomyces sp. NRRL B-1568]
MASLAESSETVHLELVGGGFKPRISVLSPGLVDTNIFHSQGNRPARFSDAGPRPGGITGLRTVPATEVGPTGVWTPPTDTSRCPTLPPGMMA